MKVLIGISGVCIPLSAVLIHKGLKGLKDCEIQDSLAYKMGKAEGMAEIELLKEELEKVKKNEDELRKQLEKKDD